MANTTFSGPIRTGSISHTTGTYDYIGNVKNGTAVADWSEPPKYMIIWTNNFFVRKHKV